MNHSRDHEETLQACLASDDPQRALAGSASSGCAVCKERVDDLMSLTETLDDLGRDIRATPATGGRVVGAALVDGVLGARLRAHQRGRRLALAAVGAAAAAVILLAVFLVQRAAVAPSATLGSARLELFEPRQETPDGERSTFTWSAELPANGRYEIRVLRADDGRELVRSTTEEPRWTTSTTGWPREIVWHVDVFDASGTLTDTRSRRSSSSR